MIQMIAQSTLIAGPGTRPHRVVLYKREHPWHPYVVHYQVEDGGSKFQGSYCESVVGAAKEFERRCKLSGVSDEAVTGVTA